MIGLLAFVRSPLGRVAVAILAVLVIVGGFYWKGRSDAKQAAETALRKENERALRTDEKARVAADLARVTDAAEVEEQREELVEAIQEIPDERPDAVRVALGCQRLRAAGQDLALVPACAGHGGGAQARPQP